MVQGVDRARLAPPKQNGAVFFGGFPGCERDKIGPHEMVFGLHSAMTRLTSLTDHQLDRTSWIDVRGLGLPPVGYDLGSVSGGPMLQLVFADGA